MTESGKMDNSLWSCPLYGLLELILCQEIYFEGLDPFKLRWCLDKGPHHLVSLVSQMASQTAADKSGNTSDEDLHGAQVAAVSTVRPRRSRQ